MGLAIDVGLNILTDSANSLVTLVSFQCPSCLVTDHVLKSASLGGAIGFQSLDDKAGFSLGDAELDIWTDHGRVGLGLLGFWDLGEGDIIPMEGNISP